MSSCEPVEDQNVTGGSCVGSQPAGGGAHGCWKSLALKWRIVGHVYPLVPIAAPVIRATAVAPAVRDDCPVAAPNSPRYVMFACTRTNTVAESTRLLLTTRLPGSGHGPPTGAGNGVHAALSMEPATAMACVWFPGWNEWFACTTARAVQYTSSLWT